MPKMTNKVLCNKTVCVQVNKNTFATSLITPNYFVSSKSSSSSAVTCLILPVNSPLTSNFSYEAFSVKRVAYFRNKTSWLFWKFKYQGKGLKIKKSTEKKQILFNLGSSHMSKLYYKSDKIYSRRTKKNTYMLFYLESKNNVGLKYTNKIRKLNKYTKRGLRLSRQPIIRRFGKVSQIASKKR